MTTGERRGDRPQVTSPFALREGTPLAAYWQRAGALMLDALIFVVTVALPATLAVWWFGDSGLIVCSERGGVEVCPELTARDRLSSRAVFYTLGAVFVAVYSLAIGRGRTVGKRATECKVVDSGTEQVIGFGRGLLRTIAMAVSLLPFGLGFLWPIWDPQNRTFHDMIARTRVISP
jgi:uncharacterized RDD family membrane protein YckC